MVVLATNDILLDRAGNDTFIGGDGVDRLYEKSDRDFVLTDNELIGNENDSITGVEVAYINGGRRSNMIDASGITKIKIILKV